MPSQFMSCTIDPGLRISPGSITGDRRVMTIVFKAATENVDQVVATYEILGPSDYKFGEPGKLSKYKRPSKLVARRIYTVLPENGEYKVKIPILREGSQQNEASLKLAASVVGIGNGKLPPVHAIGSIAVLSVGLRQLMAKRLTGKLAASGTQAFVDQAKTFVAGMRDWPELAKFKDFRSLDDQTIVNVALGETKSQAETMEKVRPLVDHFMKAVKFPKKYQGKGLFTGAMQKDAKKKA